MKKPYPINSSLRVALAIVLFLTSSVGCTTSSVVTTNTTPALQSMTLTPTDELLDIGIAPLDPNIPEDLEEIDASLIVPDVRRAESNYMSFHLKETLEMTGNWGAVRVTPEATNTADLQIFGRILQSDGALLKLEISVIDSTGSQWFQRTYEDKASKFSYQKVIEDPFQDIYNEIANDLLAERDNRTRDQILNIKTVANLKFASDLAPDAFGGYLTASKRGGMTINQLPASNDSIMERVYRIKEQEYLFVDTLDDYYSRFHRQMKPSYDQWRSYSYDEAITLRELEREARNDLITGALLIAGGIAAGSESDSYAGRIGAASVTAGGIGAIKKGLEKRKESEIYEQGLKELNQSLGQELKPSILKIEGETIELAGTAQEQYTQWRQLLRDIYREETIAE